MKKDRYPKQYIFVCNGKDCLKNGAREVQRGFEKELKSNGNKKHYRLIRTRCMDHCKEGPSVIIDNVWHGKVSPKDIPKVLNKKAVK